MAHQYTQGRNTAPEGVPGKPNLSKYGFSGVKKLVRRLSLIDPLSEEKLDAEERKALDYLIKLVEWREHPYQIERIAKRAKAVKECKRKRRAKEEAQ